MAEDYQRVVDLPVKTSSGISLLSDYLMGIDANDGYQMLINDLAKKIVEDYVGSSLGGSSRTLKSALDAISTLLGSATMGTTAQTVTGAIAEHEGDISGIGTTIGNTSMGTTATTVTGAIKEHSDKIGNTSMGTTATTLTGAIAEHEGDIDGINDFVGDTTMGTTATTITGAIAEHEGDISTLNSKFITRDYSVTTTTNPNVSPFGAYETTSSSGPSGYKAISICPVGLGSSNPVLCRLFNDEGGFFTYSASPITITVRIVYEKI